MSHTSSSSISWTSSTECSICGQYGVTEAKVLYGFAGEPFPLIEQRVYFCRHSDIEIEKFLEVVREGLKEKAIAIKVEGKSW